MNNYVNPIFGITFVEYFFPVASPVDSINSNLFTMLIKKGSMGGCLAVIHGYCRGVQRNHALMYTHIGAYELFVSLTRCIYRSRVPYKRRAHFASDFMCAAILPGSPLPRRSSLSSPRVIKQLAVERRIIVYGADT